MIQFYFSIYYLDIIRKKKKEFLTETQKKLIKFSTYLLHLKNFINSEKENKFIIRLERSYKRKKLCQKRKI